MKGSFVMTRRRRGTAWLTARSALDQAMRQRLGVDAYRRASGAELRAREIHVHELLLHIRWHQASCRGEGQHPREITLEHLRGVLGRVARSDSE